MAHRGETILITLDKIKNVEVTTWHLDQDDLDVVP
jgi:hypothetical protein